MHREKLEKTANNINLANKFIFIIYAAFFNNIFPFAKNMLLLFIYRYFYLHLWQLTLTNLLKE